jgi:hypothetical protein
MNMKAGDDAVWGRRYEMPTLDDAQKESSAATAKGRATTAAAADAAGSAVGSDRVGGAPSEAWVPGERR